MTIENEALAVRAAMPRKLSTKRKHSGQYLQSQYRLPLAVEPIKSTASQREFSLVCEGQEDKNGKFDPEALSHAFNRRAVTNNGVGHLITAGFATDYLKKFKRISNFHYAAATEPYKKLARIVGQAREVDLMAASPAPSMPTAPQPVKLAQPIPTKVRSTSSAASKRVKRAPTCSECGERTKKTFILVDGEHVKHTRDGFCPVKSCFGRNSKKARVFSGASPEDRAKMLAHAKALSRNIR